MTSRSPEREELARRIDAVAVLSSQLKEAHRAEEKAVEAQRRALASLESLPALRQLIEAFDMAIKVLPVDERRNGASFALMNVASYAVMQKWEQRHKFQRHWPVN